MTINKRRKNVRQRGSKTHGWGAMKKHRGAGNRGGKGMAGTGKRGDAKKPSIWKQTKYFGKFGFKSKSRKEDIFPVNIQYIEENLSRLISEKKIKQENGMQVINISELGFNKLLGDGKVLNKLKIKAKYASKIAVEKVKQAGGEVVIG